MAISTAAGIKLYIGSTNVPDFSQDDSGIISDYDTEFNSSAAILIGEVEDPGEFGDEVNAVTFTALADRRVRKFKGSYDAGTQTLTIAFDGEDAGQAALNDAVKDESQADYNFKLELSDRPTSTGTDTIFYYSGKVMSRRIQPGNADNVVRASITIGINSPIFEVDSGA
jgi:hypothetical protein